MKDLILGAAAKKLFSVWFRRKSEAAIDICAKPEPRHPQRGHELCRAEEGLAEGRGLSHTRITHDTNPEQVHCPLLGAGAKSLSRNSTFPTHKYTTVKKGKASSLLLSLCSFSISHNTNQTARLPRTPKESAVLLPLAAAAQRRVLGWCPHFRTAPAAAVPPCPELGTAPKLREVAPALPTQLLVQGHNQHHLAQPTHLLYTAQPKYTNPQIIRHFKNFGLTWSTWFATKSKA